MQQHSQIFYSQKKGMRDGAFYLCLLLLLSQQLSAAVFTVTNTNDSGAGSLRQAIINNNGTPGPNTINFNIPGTGPFTIAPLTDLPNITNPVTINGYSQPGSSVNTLAVGDNAVLKIILNGNYYGDYVTGSGNGLHFAGGSDGSVVRGLVINQWLDNGILIDGATAGIAGISIVGNFIGTNVTGTVQMANRAGVGISGAFNTITGTIIGTTSVADRNIFAGSFAMNPEANDYYLVSGGCISSTANTGTTIVNNYIGTDRSGTIALGNSVCGIQFIEESGSTVGGSTASARNIISGHLIYGILHLVFCSAMTIQGNYVGTDVTGTRALGNLNTGINFVGSSGNTVINNLISGNNVGINLGDSDLPGSSANTIQGNLIGTDASGTRPLPNSGFGLVITDQLNTISGNTISSNLGGGVLIFNTIGTQNSLTNNFIGTDKTGTKLLPNGGNGIQIGLYSTATGPSNNIIGS